MCYDGSIVNGRGIQFLYNTLNKPVINMDTVCSD